MKLILCIFFSALSFSAHTKLSQRKSASIELVLKNVGTLTKNNKDIPVEFWVINRNSFPVYLNNPACWGASTVLVKHNNVNLPLAIKVRVDPACAKVLVPVKANDTLKVKYNYNIDKLIDLSQTGNYKLQLKYQGMLFNEKKIKHNEISLVSNEISFEVQP